MFDLDRIRKDSGLSEPDMRRLEQKIREEFASDELMFEIHLLRAVTAFKEGWISLENLLRETVDAWRDPALPSFHPSTFLHFLPGLLDCRETSWYFDACRGTSIRRTHLPMTDQKKEKTKYEKPAIIYQERIEARAGVCGGPPSKSATATCTPPLTS